MRQIAFKLLIGMATASVSVAIASHAHANGEAPKEGRHCEGKSQNLVSVIGKINFGPAALQFAPITQSDQSKGKTEFTYIIALKNKDGKILGDSGTSFGVYKVTTVFNAEEHSCRIVSVISEK